MVRLRLVALPFLLTLCASCTGETVPSINNGVKWVQDRTVAICSYLPAATSVSQVILATNATAEATFEAISNAICQSVAEWQQQTKQSTVNAAVMPCPRVNGICIEGEFVGPKPEGSKQGLVGQGSTGLLEEMVPGAK